MRVAIIVLIVLAVALALYFAAGPGHIQLWKLDAPDTNNADAWTAPPVANTVNDLVAPFAPHANWNTNRISLDPAGIQTLIAAAPQGSKEGMEVAKLTVAGGGLAARYACSSDDYKDCPITLCVCAPGAVLTASRIGACSLSFRNANSGGVCAPDAKPSGTLVIYPDARQIVVSNLGPQTLSATVK